MLNVLFDLSLLGMIRLLLYVAIGAVIGVFMSVYITPKNRLMYFRERDGRGEEQKIIEENHGFIRTNRDKQFIKHGRAYEFASRFGRKITTFLAKEGTAFTYVLEGFKPKYSKDEKVIPLKFEHEFESAEDLVMYAWGSKFYNTVPLRQKELLKDKKVLMTVDLEPGLTPGDYKAMTEQDINDEGDKRFLELLGVSIKGAIKTPFLYFVFAIGTGAALFAVVSLFFGWIQLAKVG